MTTIAASLTHKAMAADSRITGGVISHAEKVRRFGDSLFGVAGDWEVCTAFFDWLGTDRKEKPTFPDGEFEAIELTRSGIYLYQRGCIRTPLLDRFYACGAGQQGAMVAMSLGHDPKAAIVAVARFDETTGPPIKSYSL